MRDPAASHRDDSDDRREGHPNGPATNRGEPQSDGNPFGVRGETARGGTPRGDGSASSVPRGDGSAADKPRGDANDVSPPAEAAAPAAGDVGTSKAGQPTVPARREPSARSRPNGDGDESNERDPAASRETTATTSDPSTHDAERSVAESTTRASKNERVAGTGASIDTLLVDDTSMISSDLKTKVTEAWHDFARALAAAIAELPSGAHLDISLDPAATGSGATIYEVSVQHNPDDHLGALAVGNATLPEGARLSRDAIAEMIVIGWSPPGVVAGSEKDFGLTAAGTDAARVAVVLTKTLRDVYGSPHPAFLRYTAHDADENPITIEPLGSARVSTGDDKLDSLRLSAEGFSALQDPSMSLIDRVKIVVAGLQRTDPDSLQVDKDGDIGIRSGSAMVFVRVRDTPPLVDVFSPILTEVEPSEKLYARLSDLTTKMPIGRLYQANKTVWASVPVFGRDFQPTHLMLAVQVMTGLADELDDRLHGEFGGRRFFGEGDSPVATPDSEANTGMYL